jgi:hypothetical protein
MCQAVFGKKVKIFLDQSLSVTARPFDWRSLSRSKRHHHGVFRRGGYFDRLSSRFDAGCQGAVPFACVTSACRQPSEKRSVGATHGH